MTLDPRTPVIIGVGQYNHRADGLDDALEPVALMERAVREASAEDAGLDGPPSARLGARGQRHRLALPQPRTIPRRPTRHRHGPEVPNSPSPTPGGNSPQSLVNRTALDIAAGDVDVAILAGAEAFRTFMRARKEGVKLDWPKGAEDDDRPSAISARNSTMNLHAETGRGIVMPVQIYPMFETALRAAAGRTVDGAPGYLGRLWSDLSHVAAGNPNAWIQDPKTPDEITTIGPKNRMVGFPYPKLMNSNSDVDQGAALIMCSVEAARRLGRRRGPLGVPAAGTDCHEHDHVSHRDTFARTPAIELGGARVSQLAGVTIDEVELLDLYSCFPAAVQLGAQSLGVDLYERQWSRTGGLPFAGGPWNNYPMHAIATIVGELREQRERPRPRVGQRRLRHQALIRRLRHHTTCRRLPLRIHRRTRSTRSHDATSRARRDAAGPADIEAYSVMFSRDGEPETALASCLLGDGRRAWGTSTDPAIAAAMCDGEWVGVTVRLDSDGTLLV